MSVSLQHCQELVESGSHVVVTIIGSYDITPGRNYFFCVMPGNASIVNTTRQFWKALHSRLKQTPGLEKAPLTGRERRRGWRSEWVAGLVSAAEPNDRADSLRLLEAVCAGRQPVLVLLWTGAAVEDVS